MAEHIEHPHSGGQLPQTDGACLGERMTVRGYASARGVAHTTVDYHIRKGGIIRGDDGKIDATQADRYFSENVDKQQSLRGRGQQRRITGEILLPGEQMNHESRRVSAHAPSPVMALGVANARALTGSHGAAAGGQIGGRPAAAGAGNADRPPSGAGGNVIDLNVLRDRVPIDYNDAAYLASVEILLEKRRDNLEAEGKLAQTELMQRTEFELSRQIRDNMLAITPRVQDILAAETDPKEVGRILTEEIRQALESAAKMAQELADEDAAQDDLLTEESA